MVPDVLLETLTFTDHVDVNSWHFCQLTYISKEEPWK
ncbi:unnamed protein product [Coffea canephora]|uniref:DH200=94 genomic scaffold, scaffold_216 n=1 Tax=Coffea canephora TaxID=49390 RepID=A0A068VC26_COFCA|nr:unnamed protein product [Coffea canephora]